MKNNLSRITPRQFMMAWIAKSLTIAIISSTDLIITAGRDIWISVFIGASISLLTLAILLKLASFFPKENLAQWSVAQFGKFPGSVITLFYISVFLFYCFLSINEYGQMITSIYVPENPDYIYYGLLLIPAVYCSYLGISVTYRFVEIILPAIIFLGLIVLAFNYPYVDITNYLPILENGIKPVLLGGLKLGYIFVFFVVILTLYPSIQNKNNKRLFKLGIQGLIIIILTTELALSSLIGVFGYNYLTKLQYHQIELARNISISHTFSRLDILVLLMWIIGIFVFVSSFLYVAAILTKDLFRLKNYRFIVVIYGLLVFCLGLAKLNIIQLLKIYSMALTYLELSVSLLIPLIMLVVVSLQKNRNKS